MGILISREDLEKALDEIKKLPPKIWIYNAGNEDVKLMSYQLELAMLKDLVRYRRVKNPYIIVRRSKARHHGYRGKP